MTSDRQFRPGDTAAGQPSAGPLLRDLPHLDAAALYLDFDGTLVDIADRPDGIHVPESLGPLLARLCAASRGATVLVSGRRLSDVERFLPGFPGPIVASHGAERREDGERSAHPAVGSAELAALKADVRGWADRHEGVLVEDKPASVVLHYRQAPHHGDAAGKAMQQIADAHPGFVLHAAKMALELHPEGVSKGAALARIHAARWPRRRPVAIGDDLTDEAMMAEALDLGGVAVKVGEGPTCAGHRLPDPAAVRALLHAWLTLAEEKDR